MITVKPLSSFLTVVRFSNAARSCACTPPATSVRSIGTDRSLLGSARIVLPPSVCERAYCTCWLLPRIHDDNQQTATNNLPPLDPPRPDPPRCDRARTRRNARLHLRQLQDLSIWERTSLLDGRCADGVVRDDVRAAGGARRRSRVWRRIGRDH